MAAAVARAIEERSALVVEAGTGVGKTYAYLVPTLLSGARTLVSTATKSLQDQLFLRDLPRLVEALRLPVSLALLKGRGSYLCLHRLGLARQPDAPPPADARSLRTLGRIEQWAQSTRSGDLAEIAGLDERSPVIPLVTSTRDNCLGTDCPQFRDCHVMKARREAMAADVAVVNHHLFFADVALRDTGMAELLPSVEVAVFDEAHQLAEAGLQFLGVTLGSAQVADFAHDLLAAGAQHARGQQPWQALAAACERAGARAAPRRRRRAGRGAGQPQAALGGARAARGLRRRARRAARGLRGGGEGARRLRRRGRRPRAPARARRRARRRGGGLRRAGGRRAHALDRRRPAPRQAGRLAARHPRRAARAARGGAQGLGLHLGHARRRRAAELVHRAGRARRRDRPARRQPVRLRRPRAALRAGGIPEAGRAGAPGGRRRCSPRAARAPSAAAPSCSRRRCARCTPSATRCAPSSRRTATASRCWCRAACPSASCCSASSTVVPAVLVGSHSFWEGIDVPGEALQCVLIDKLPFPPPGDPLVQARVARLEAEGATPSTTTSSPRRRWRSSRAPAG